MRYVLRQKLLAWGDDFTIRDADNRDCYVVDGKVLALGDKAAIRDLQGREVGRIEQRLLSLGTKYDIYRDGRPMATVKKKRFTLFRDVFDIEDAAAGDLDAEGDFFDREYRFTRDGRTIATVSKHYFSFTDSYGLDIADGEDDVLILACAVVIDMCCHDE